MIYKVGTAVKNINPHTSLLSVALAGYGAPAAGRFSLTWDWYIAFPDIKAAAISGDHIYVYTEEQGLLSGIFKADKINWSKLNTELKLKALAGDEQALYALDEQGHLRYASLKHGLQAWELKIASPLMDDLFLHDGSLYVCCVDNHIYKYTDADLKTIPVLAGNRQHMQSIVSNGHTVYGVDNENRFWRSNPDEGFKWVLVGRHNDYTVNIMVQRLLFFRNVFYGLTKEGCYAARHAMAGDLLVTATAIGSSDDTVVIVSADITGFDYAFIEGVKATISERTGLPSSAVLINASHTHFAPVTQDWTAWQEFYHHADPAYLNFLKDQIVASVEAALENMEPAALFFSRGSTHIGYNRRPEVNPDATYDNTLDVVTVRDVEGKIKTCLFMAGCHPVFKNEDVNSPFTLSANFPGIARKMIVERTGSPAQFLQGFSGDINPVDENYERSGKQLFADVSNLLDGGKEEITGKLTHSFNEIELPVHTWKKETVIDFKALNLAAIAEMKVNSDIETPESQFILTPLLERNKDVKWADIMLERSRTGQQQKALKIYIQVITIGQWKLVGLSREIVADYASPIRSLWPDHKVSLAGYCNDVSSYLPVDWHIEAKTYEGYDSFFWYAQSGIPGLNVKEQLIEKIEKLNLPHTMHKEKF